MEVKESPNRKVKRQANKKRKLQALLELNTTGEQKDAPTVKKKRRKDNPPKKMTKKKTTVNGVKTNLVKRKMTKKTVNGITKKKMTKKTVNGVKTNLAKKKTRPNKSKRAALKSSLSTCSYSQLKQMKKKIDKKKSPWPYLTITDPGRESQMSCEDGKTKPLSWSDVQTLIVNHLMPGKFPVSPRWITVGSQKEISHTVVVLLEGIGTKSLKKHFKNGKKCENTYSRSKLPSWLSGSLPHTCSSLRPEAFEILPTSSKPEEELLCTANNNKSSWNIEDKESECNEVDTGTEGDSKSCSESDTSKNTNVLHPSDKFDRRQLILSPSDLYFFGYPVPNGNGQEDYVFSKHKYVEVKPTSPMFGLDCEMCMVMGNKSALTSVSIIDEDSKVVYNQLVKPRLRIINYLTKYSGITKSLLKDVTTTLQQVQAQLRELLPQDAILVGHSLQNDLKALKMLHPYLIDSAVAFNLSYIRKKYSSLKNLTKMFLKWAIQTGTDGHDPTEDATASLKLIQKKLAEGFSYGNVLEGYQPSSEGNEVESTAVAEVVEDETPENYYSLFQHAAKSRLKTSLLMTINTAKYYDGFLENVPKDKLDIHLLKGNKELSKKAAAISMSKDITYLHMKVNKFSEAESEEERISQLRKLDMRLKRVYDGACQKALIVYIFTESACSDTKKGSNGFVMCTVKKGKDA